MIYLSTDLGDLLGDIRLGCDLSRLWFILTVATLYVTAQRGEVVDTGRRRWADTYWFRGKSYFQIGLEWVRSALQDGWPLMSPGIQGSHVSISSRLTFVSQSAPQQQSHRKQGQFRVWGILNR